MVNNRLRVHTFAKKRKHIYEEDEEVEEAEEDEEAEDWKS